MARKPAPIHPWPKVRLFILSTWLSAAEETVRDFVSGFLYGRAAILGNPDGPPHNLSRSAWNELCARIQTDRLKAIKTVRSARQIAATVDDWPKSKQPVAALTAMKKALHKASAPPSRKLLAKKKLPTERLMLSTADRLEKLAGKVRAFRIRLSSEDADLLARELWRADPEFMNKTAAQWASAIGCATGLVPSLSAWEEAMELTGRGRKQGLRKRKTIPLTDKVITSMTLKRLTEEQDRDYEPSPLENDPGARHRRKAVNRKRY